MNLMSIFGAPTSFTGPAWAGDRCIESDRAWGGGTKFAERRTSLNNGLSWNVANRPDNNFGMVRGRINFAL
jgi:hypothetical protein